MSAREGWLSVGLVALVALIARIASAGPVVYPVPEDTAYYVGVAQALVGGEGLVSDAIWSYATPPLEFPRPAFEIWMPLPTFLAAIPVWLFGAAGADLGTAHMAAQRIYVPLGILVCVLAWRLAADVAVEVGLTGGRARVLAIGTGLTTAVSLPALLYSAVPDSTMPFAAVVLAATLLMTRVLRDPRGARWLDPRTIGIGLCLGVAALTRNEAIWLALTWAGLVAVARGGSGSAGDSGDGRPGLDRAARVRLVGTAAVVAIACYAPWAIRNEIAFGSFLPGQALSNALSIRGTDIFAWADPPTLERYLAQGWAAILEARLVGVLHNLLNVLVFLGVPVSILGLLGLPWLARVAAVRPLLVFAVVTFLVTSLVFPVSTTWGTFLHAAGAIHVLLIVSALLALDRGIDWVGTKRGWTRPVAWLGATLTVTASLLFSFVLLPAFGSQSTETARRYAAIDGVMAAAGLPLGDGPVIADYPIWLAEAEGIRTLALPDETPPDVLSLARAFPGTTVVLTFGGLHEVWFDAVDGGGEGAACFEEVDLPAPTDPDDAAAVADARAWRIVCP
jgi:hypothetical protein